MVVGLVCFRVSRVLEIVRFLCVFGVLRLFWFVYLGVDVGSGEVFRLGIMLIVFKVLIIFCLFLSLLEVIREVLLVIYIF